MGIEASIVNAALAVFGSVASVAGLGWWLSGRFRSVENSQREMLATHEREDQRRHEENLERFKKNAVALARLGDRNGSS